MEKSLARGQGVVDICWLKLLSVCARATKKNFSDRTKSFESKKKGETILKKEDLHSKVGENVSRVKGREGKGWLSGETVARPAAACVPGPSLFMAAAQAPADTSSRPAALAVVHHASLPNHLHQDGGGSRGWGG